MKTPGQHILISAQHLAEGEKQLDKTREPVWIGFLKRESSILLRRVFKFWLIMRFRR